MRRRLLSLDTEYLLLHLSIRLLLAVSAEEISNFFVASCIKDVHGQAVPYFLRRHLLVEHARLLIRRLLCPVALPVLDQFANDLSDKGPALLFFFRRNQMGNLQVFRDIGREESRSFFLRGYCLVASVPLTPRILFELEGDLPT